MTNYESTVYTVEDDRQDTSAAFSTLPDSAQYVSNAPEHTRVMKLWHSTTLPDGQPINVSVEFTLDDVRGLQAYLNDNFGRGQARVGAHRPAGYDGGTVDFYNEEYDPIKPGDKVTVIPAKMHVNDGEPKQGYVVLPEQGHEGHGSERLATLDGLPGMLEPSDLSGGWADSQQPRQCPVIYNGVQCLHPEHHDRNGLGHEFGFQTATTFPVDLPQSGDGATPPAVLTPTPGATGGETGLETGQAAESATAAPTAEAPSPSEAEPAKKKVNRRKKEEKAYDDALEHFRANPQMQTAYVDLQTAAEALRKRFPDATRLERYDAHIQMQDVNVLLDSSAAVQPVADAPASSPAPSFAPEPAAQQPTPFVPPVAMPAPEQQSDEEVRAAAAFPCQHRSEVSGRQCTRPAGHELANPPKPHIYGELPSGQSLPVPNFIPPMPQQQPGFTVTPVGEGSGFTQATIPPFQIPQPTQESEYPPIGYVGTGVPAPTAPVQAQPEAQVLSFQVPPTPQVQGAELQPPAPAAPPWSQS